MNNRFSGKTAIITGGSQGIGLVTAETFLKQGAFVAIWDINEAAGTAAIDNWKSQGFSCLFQQVNTTDSDATLAAAAEVKERFGTIDILINNAGITRDSSFKKMTSEQWQSVIDVNLTGVFNCTKAVYPYMAEQLSGRILNAASIVGIYGNFGQTNYVATKAGLIGMTRTWAREFGPKGITVNAVAPGFIKTDMVKTIPEEYLTGLVKKTPMQRMGEAQDIANAYAFLASEEASFITGITLSVDGGLVM